MTTYINITDREYEILQESIVSVIEHPYAWYDSIPRHDLGDFGVRDYSWYKQHGASGVEISMTGSVQSFGAGFIEKSTAVIPVFSKDIRVFKRDIDASRRYGGSLETRAQNTVAVRFREDIEDAIGDTGVASPIAVTALPEDATHTDVTGNDWASPANIPLVIQVALNDLVGKRFTGPYHSVMTAGLKLTMAVPTTYGSAETWREWVDKQIGGGINFTFFMQTNSESYWARATDTVTTSKNACFLGQKVSGNNNNYELLIAKEPTLVDLSAGKWDPEFKLYAALIHEIYRPYSFVCITSIDELD